MEVSAQPSEKLLSEFAGTSLKQPSQRRSRSKTCVEKQNRPSSSVRAEVKLYSQYKVFQQKVKQMKMKQEEEQVSQMQDKPRICKKSAKLAQRAEEKFFSQCGISFTHTQSLVPESPIKEHYKKFRPQTKLVIPEPELYLSPILKLKKVPVNSHDAQDKIDKRHRKQKKNKKNTKKNGQNRNNMENANKGFYYMSVLDRNKLWLTRKSKRLEEMRGARDEEIMKECTFAPVCFSKVSTIYQHFSPSQLKGNEFVGTMQNMSKNDSMHSVNQGDYSPLSPFNQKFGFSEGCDIRNFVARSSLN